MGMKLRVLKYVLGLDYHRTDPLAFGPSPATIPLNNDERPVKWVPDGYESWRIVYAD